MNKHEDLSCFTQEKYSILHKDHSVNHSLFIPSFLLHLMSTKSISVKPERTVTADFNLSKTQFQIRRHHCCWGIREFPIASF